MKRDGEWVTWTFKDYYTDATKAAKSMICLGLEPHRGVCILGFNAPEWHISYMGAIMVSWEVVGGHGIVISILSPV